jgi:hypothetical protein
MGVARVAWRRLEAMITDGLDSGMLHEQIDHLQSDLAALHARSPGNISPCINRMRRSAWSRKVNDACTMPLSLSFPRYGDKLNSAFFEEYLGQLMEERDRAGLTGLIRQIDALMITVEPGHSLAYVAELCLMTPYHYLVTLESETHFSHVLRIDMRFARHPGA